MLKVGLVSPFLPEKDGIAIYSDNLLRGMVDDRRHIVTIGRKGSDADYIVDFKSFSLKGKLEKIILKEGLDAVHFQYVATFFSRRGLNYNLIDALRLPVPTVVTLHEVHYSGKGLKNKVLRAIERKIVKRADKIIVHTPRQKEFLRKKYKTNKIVMIYHGLRLNDIPKRKAAGNILCFGMISHGKGVPYLINAMKYLPDYELTIAGKFVDKKSKEEVISALKKSPSNIKTEFGWIDEGKKEEYYKNADIVVLPHIWAPYQSGILHNSVSWKLPVVVTGVGALWEMVKLFKFGEIVKPKSSKAIAEGIRKVFKEYPKYKSGIDRYRKVANWKQVGKEHLSLYRAIEKNE